MPFAIADIIVTGVVAIVISGTRCAALYWGAGLRNRLCWGFAKEGGSAYLWWWVYLARGGCDNCVAHIDGIRNSFERVLRVMGGAVADSSKSVLPRRGSNK